MQAKQSFTAMGSQRSSGAFSRPTEINRPLSIGPAGRPRLVGSCTALAAGFETASCPAILDNEGLLHDARNLIGALGLYCDLLAMPGVLGPEHRHYAEEVRLLGTRSARMIQQLMEHRIPSARELARLGCACPAAPNRAEGSQAAAPGAWEADSEGRAPAAAEQTRPTSLRSVIEGLSGMLGRVAGGRAVEICYGPAAMAPVRIGEEALERILVNLVRNAAAALRSEGPNAQAAGCAGPGSEVEGAAPPGTSAEAGVGRAAPRGTVRIGVGQLVNRVGDPKPWPFRRVRLTVEDSGCGMDPEQLARLLRGSRAPARGSHGIGFRVVRELVAATGGDLQATSAPGAGTRVQIEWPMAAPSSNGGEDDGVSPTGEERRRAW